MLKKYIYACLLAVLTLLTYSCKKDIGNYDYHEINEVKFNSDLNGKISVLTLTQLIIHPTIEFTQDANVTDPNRYSYEWVFVIDAAVKTLAKTKDLDVFISEKAGIYNAYYRITDNVTGVVFRKSFQLEIRNVYNEGWLLMTEVNGKARVDMLARQRGGEFIVVTDLLTKANAGLELKGKPKVVYSYNCGALNGFGINLPYAIYFGTDQSIDRVNPETFAWQPNYNVKYEILTEVPANFSINVVKRVNGIAANGCYMISSTGDVYYTSQAPANKYSQTLNFDATEGPYKVAPFIGGNENSVVPVISQYNYFYDIDHKRFKRHLSVNDSKLLAVPEPNGSVSQPLLFSYINTGKDLIYMTLAKNNQVTAILKDPATGKFYLARFEANTAKQLYYQEIVGKDFDKAENFAVSNQTGYLFYSVGGKLYLYDTTPAIPLCTEVYDYGAAKISVLKFQIYHLVGANYPITETDKLVVCSYDPALPEGTNGKLEKFSIQNGGTGLTKEPNYTFTGFGKVQSLHYRER